MGAEPPEVQPALVLREVETDIKKHNYVDLATLVLRLGAYALSSGAVVTALGLHGVTGNGIAAAAVALLGAVDKVFVQK